MRQSHCGTESISQLRFVWILLLLICVASARHSAAAAVFQVFAADGLARFGPKDLPRNDATAVHLYCGKNEYEPFQIIVQSGSNGLQNVNVTTSNLRDRRGNQISTNVITLFLEHYVEVKKASPKSNEGAGFYPDALIPFVNPYGERTAVDARFHAAPFNVPPESNQPVWVDVFVPDNTPPGEYSGTVKVTATGQGTVTISVTLTVWNFALPDKPSMRSNFGGFGSRIAKAHHLEVNTPEFRKVERRYCASLAAHGLSPPIPGYLMPEVRADGNIDPGATHAGLKEWIDSFHVTGIPVSLLGRDPLGKDRDRNVKYLQTLYAYLKTNGWEKLSYIYVLDEPNDANAYEEVRRRAAFIHQAAPGIKVLCTEQPTPQEPGWGTLVGSVDIWVPLWTLFDEKATAERLRAGEELWSYTALCQGAKGKDTPYWEIDFPLLDYRIPAWMSWRYGATGLLYWTTVYWEKAGDVWTNAVSYGDSAAFNGEGSLFYPGADAGIAGPVASMRLKQIREALEDYEYLKLLAGRGERSFADECARRIAEGWTQWDPNAADLYTLRRMIGERLSTLKQ